MNVDLTLAGAVIITGLVVVFIALVGLSLLVWLVGKLMVALTQKPSKPAAPKQTPPAPAKAPAPAPQAKAAQVVEEGISDEIIAVISAAVAAMDGGAGNLVLRSVRRAREARPSWAQAGLIQNTQPF